MTTVAVMQPTFLPWLGYFDLMDQVDHFVYLDTVQFSKQSWQQRNRIRTDSGLSWVSVPVSSRQQLRTTIDAIELARTPTFPDRILGQMANAYRRAPHLDQLSGILDRIEATPEGSHLADLNIGIIEDLRALLAIDTPTVRSSEMDLSGERSSLIIDIVVQLGGTEYVTPPGACGYLQDDLHLYRDAGLPILVHQYEHPVYRQLHEPFEPYASIVDLIAVHGTSEAGDVMRSGRQAPVEIDQYLMAEAAS